jgi:hypothetical protein
VFAFVFRPAIAGRRMIKGAMARLSPARWIWPEEDNVDGEAAGGLADEIGGDMQPERAIVYRPDSENPRARG